MKRRPQVPYYCWMAHYSFTYQNKEYTATSIGSLRAIANNLGVFIYPYAE